LQAGLPAPRRLDLANRAQDYARAKPANQELGGRPSLLCRAPPPWDAVTVKPLSRSRRSRWDSPGRWRSRALGRTFIDEEGEIGGEQKVILSYVLWQRLYGGSPAAAGRELRSARPLGHGKRDGVVGSRGARRLCVAGAPRDADRSGPRAEPAVGLRLNPHLGQPVPQGVAGQAQKARRLALVAAGAVERLADELLLALLGASELAPDDAGAFHQVLQLSQRDVACRLAESAVRTQRQPVGGDVL